MMTASELEGELRTLLGLARRLMPPLNHRPELFHEQKSALERGVKDLMERCGFGIAASPRAFSSATSDSGVRAVQSGGRAIPVERRGWAGRS